MAHTSLFCFLSLHSMNRVLVRTAHCWFSLSFFYSTAPGGENILLCVIMCSSFLLASVSSGLSLTTRTIPNIKYLYATNVEQKNRSVVKEELSYFTLPLHQEISNRLQACHRGCQPTNQPSKLPKFHKSTYSFLETKGYCGHL